jgi:cation diffusion facilitator CzcD-associated flavoprotein CzcO
VTPTPVVVVGAGPYGLSVAAHLASRGIPHRLFGRSFESWRRHMPRGMFLKSEGFASSLSDPRGELTLRRFCSETHRPYEDVGLPVALSAFVDYGAWFRREAAIDVEDLEVAAIARARDGFRLELASGEEIGARRVVIATGITPFPHVPSELAGVGAPLVTHTFDHETLEAFAGSEVAVVGAGQSAIETAVLLDEAGASVQILARAPALLWNPVPEPGPRSLRGPLRAPRTGLGESWKFWAYTHRMTDFRRLRDATRERIVRTALGPAGAWWLRDRLSAGVRVHTRTTVRKASEKGDRVVLTLGDGDVRELEVDHVIAGTGYKVDVSRFSILAPVLRGEIRSISGWPRLDAHFQSSVRGLYFVGLPAANTFGPAMRFVFGSAVAAGRVVRHVERHLDD